MIQWLINVLTPVFTGMGVSPTDVEQYVTSLSGYIYAIQNLFEMPFVRSSLSEYYAVISDNR